MTLRLDLDRTMAPNPLARAFRPTSLTRVRVLLLLVPLLFVALGGWQWTRGAHEAARYGRTAVAMRASADRLSALAARAPDEVISFPGQPMEYSARLAAPMLQKAAGRVRWLAFLSTVRIVLAGIVVVAALVTLGAGAAALVLAAQAQARSTRSREELAQGFTRLRSALPAVLGAQIAGLTAASSAAILFETADLFYLHLGQLAEIKLGLAGVAVALFVLWLAALTVRRLGGMLRALEREAMPLLARPLGRDQAPELWELVSRLAARQGAPMPDAIVSGIAGGFFVTASPVALRPVEQRLEGRTLHLPAPFLACLSPEEVSAVVAHELAHFTGEDLAYSQRFLPVYVSFGRAIEAIGAARTSLPYPWIAPAGAYLAHLRTVFDEAVKARSRERELAADAASAQAVDARTCAETLLRVSMIEPFRDGLLQAVMQHPDRAPRDLITAMAFRIDEVGFGDAAAHLDDSQEHPTDTHPTVAARLKAWGVPLDRDLQASASRLVDLHEGAGRLVADWEGVRAQLSADLVQAARDDATAYEEALQAVADKAGPEPVTLYERTVRRTVGFGVAGALFLALALWCASILATSTFTGSSPRTAGWAADALLFGLAALLAGLSFSQWRVRGSPLMVVGPDGLLCRGLDREIPWSAIAGIGVQVSYMLVTSLWLRPDAEAPRRLSGWRTRVRGRGERRRVVLLSNEPRGMSIAAYGDLLQTHLSAAWARRTLAERKPQDAASPAGVVAVVE